MEIIKFSLGQLQANCYFLIKGDECLIIDPADEAAFILEELQRRKLTLVGMLATHGHFDHIMAAGETQKSINISLHIFREDKFLIDRLEETAEYFLGYVPAIVKPISIKHLIEMKYKIGKFRLNVIHTPGHSPGSCCFYFREEKIIFTGDTLFKQGIGRYDFSYSDKRNLKKSLEVLLKLSGDTLVCPGHGEKTKISDEKQASTLIY